MAAQRGSATLCDKILANGADIAAYNSAYDTPLVCAIRSNNPDAVKFLLGRGAKLFTDDSRSWLRVFDAVMVCSPEVNALLPDWNLSDLSERKDASGLTILYSAVRQVNEELVALLLSVRADPNVADAEGMTPLHRAVRLRNERLTQLLMQAGANAALKNKDGETALDVTKYTQEEIAALRAPVARQILEKAGKLLATATTYYKDGEFGQAIQEVADLSQGTSKEALSARLLIAQCLVGNNDPNAAIERLRTIIKEADAGEVGAKALLLVGMIHLQLEQPKEAQVVFDELLKKYPQSPFAKEASEINRRLATFEQAARHGEQP